jgi:putative hydrolase of the HAD superfamily
MKRTIQQAQRNMFAKTPVRAIAFDAAGTLIHLPKGAAHHYAEVAARHGLALDPARLTQAFRTVWTALPPPPTTQTRRPDDDRGWWQTLVNEVLSQCGVLRNDSFDRTAYFDELYAEFTLPGIWECYPDAIPVLIDLSQRFTLSVISNFDGRLCPVLDQLGLLAFFREVVISSEVGADKPHPWIFDETARRLGLLPEQILHVGDDPEADWRGASSAGFQVFELKRPANSLHDLADSL